MPMPRSRAAVGGTSSPKSPSCGRATDAIISDRRAALRPIKMRKVELIIIAFLLLPYAMDAVTGIALFALAGFACSAFLPLTISLASQRFPRQIALVSSMLIAALMVGVGMG